MKPCPKCGRDPLILMRIGVVVDGPRPPRPRPWWRRRREPDALLPFEHPIVEVEP